MTEHEQDPRIDDALADARRSGAEPPPGFAASVMRRVHEAQGALSWRERRQRRAAAANFSKVVGVDTSAIGGPVIMKKILLSTAAVGAVVIVAAYLMGFPPANDGTEATVGAANRYQGAQMSAKDVTLGNQAVQNFIQSDVFAKLVRTPETRAMLARIGSDAAFRDTVLNAAFAEAARDANLEAALSGDAAVALSEPAFLDAMRNAAFADAARHPAFLEAMRQPAFADMMRKAGKGQQEYLRSPVMRAAMAEPAVQAAFKDTAALAVMRQPAFLDALARPAFAEALGRPAFAEALGRPAFQLALKNVAFGEALRHPAFLDAMRAPAMFDAMRHPAFLDAMRQPAFVDAMRAPMFNAAFADAARKLQ